MGVLSMSQAENQEAREIRDQVTGLLRQAVEVAEWNRRRAETRWSGGISTAHFIDSFCIIRFDLGRNIGHTAAVRSLARRGQDLVVFPFEVEVSGWYTGASPEQRPVLAEGATVGQVLRRKFDTRIEAGSRIFFDGPRRMNFEDRLPHLVPLLNPDVHPLLVVIG